MPSTGGDSTSRVVRCRIEPWEAVRPLTSVEPASPEYNDPDRLFTHSDAVWADHET